MKRIISLVIIITCVNTIKSQIPEVDDAIIYSQNFPTLSARSLAMGGAFTSLGGDFSSTFINPAGLGLYRKSEFSFSPGLGFTNTSANYLGQKNNDYKYQFIMSNIGYVGTYNSNNDKGLKSISYAIGYNRLNNFNSLSYARGENLDNSLIDNFMIHTDGLSIDGIAPEDLDPFTSRLAFDAYLIDTIPGSAYEYSTPVFLPVDQRRTVENKGGTGQWTLAIGLNISDVWYIGMGLGFYQLNYEKTINHSEFDISESDYDQFHYTENLDVNGTGFNFNIGTIVRLFEIVRVGASFHMPTYYKIDEDYMNSIYSIFDEGTGPAADNGRLYSADGSFTYKLNTPLRLQGGASVQLGKSGIISADVEYIDYSSMKLREDDNSSDFREDNDFIKDIYRPVVNIKAGGELRFDNYFARLGGAYYPSPYSSWTINKDASHGEVTAGFGYRSSSFFFDLGFSSLFNKEKQNLYSVGNVNNIADYNQKKFRFIASIGFRF